MLPGLLPPPVRGTDLLAAAQESTNPWSVGGLMRDIYNVAQCDLEKREPGVSMKILKEVQKMLHSVAGPEGFGRWS